MKNKFFLPCFLLNLITFFSTVQTINYSVLGRTDFHLIDFSIIGHFNNHSLIYEHTPTAQTINVFDDKMNLVDKKEMGFLPSSILGADVI